MKRHGLFGERLPRNHSQSTNFQNVMRKELYVWSEEHQVQRVNVNQKALHHCLKNGKDPLFSSKDVGNRAGSASTRDQDGLRFVGGSRRDGHSSGQYCGTQRLTSRGTALRNSSAYGLKSASPRGQRREAHEDNDRQQNSSGGRSGYSNGDNQANRQQNGRAERRQTSNQQPAIPSSGYDRPKNNRGSSSVKHRPHRSRNAIEVIEALNETDQKARVHSKVGMLVNKRFEVQQMLDQGSYGQIYVGFDHLLLRKVAVKFDEGKRKAERAPPSKRNHLKDEYDIYTTIRNKYPSGKLEGIPEPYWYGEEFGFRILALELLGASLHALFTFCDFKLGLETVFEIGQQMLERVRAVHESGYIHCDIKPENFLMGVGAEESVLYLIDFGLSRKYRYIDDDGSLKHISQEKTSKGYVGTAKYASLNSLRCQALSRRDDLESVAYVLAEMIKGETPFRKARRWHGDDVQLNKRQRYLHSKERVDWNQACPQMAVFIEYCKHLSFEEEPDYDYLMKCLRRATTRNTAAYPSLTVETLECYPCRRKKAMADARPERLNDSIVSGADAQMAVAMRRSNVFPTAISRPQLSCRTDIDLADCAKSESNSVKDLAAYATEQAQRYGWKFSQDSLLEPRKCRRCEERLKSFYDAEKQPTGELSWHVRRRIDNDARTMYGHRFWWTTTSFLNVCEDQQ